MVYMGYFNTKIGDFGNISTRYKTASHPLGVNGNLFWKATKKGLGWVSGLWQQRETFCILKKVSLLNSKVVQLLTICMLLAILWARTGAWNLKNYE